MVKSELHLLLSKLLSLRLEKNPYKAFILTLGLDLAISNVSFVSKPRFTENLLTLS